MNSLARESELSQPSLAPLPNLPSAQGFPLSLSVDLVVLLMVHVQITKHYNVNNRSSAWQLLQLQQQLVSQVISSEHSLPCIHVWGDLSEC